MNPVQKLNKAIGSTIKINNKTKSVIGALDDFAECQFRRFFCLLFKILIILHGVDINTHTYTKATDFIFISSCTSSRLAFFCEWFFLWVLFWLYFSYDSVYVVSQTESGEVNETSLCSFNFRLTYGSGGTKVHTFNWSEFSSFSFIEPLNRYVFLVKLNTITIVKIVRVCLMQLI